MKVVCITLQYHISETVCSILFKVGKYAHWHVLLHYYKFRGDWLSGLRIARTLLFLVVISLLLHKINKMAHESTFRRLVFVFGLNFSRGSPLWVLHTLDI